MFDLRGSGREMGPLLAGWDGGDHDRSEPDSLDANLALRSKTKTEVNCEQCKKYLVIFITYHILLSNFLKQRKKSCWDWKKKYILKQN